MSLPLIACVGIFVAAAAWMAFEVWTAPVVEDGEDCLNAAGDFPHLPSDFQP